jgi:hypothetical protein
MSTFRRAGERPRVTILVVVLAALALVGAGFIGAAIGRGDEPAPVTDGDAAAELEAEQARSFELEAQLSAALRRIEDLREATARAAERREEARSRSSSGSQGQRQSRENQP